MIILQDFILMLSFKELKECFFLLLIELVLMLLITQLKILIRVSTDSHRKYFLPRVNMTIYNVLIDGRNFYDQPIDDQINKYDEIRKITTEKEDDYTDVCWIINSSSIIIS